MSQRKARRKGNLFRPAGDEAGAFCEKILQLAAVETARPEHAVIAFEEALCRLVVGLGQTSGIPVATSRKFLLDQLGRMFDTISAPCACQKSN